MAKDDSSLPRSALAVFAHPDDIEFVAAGTMLLLAEAGYELHYMTVANGSGGSATLPAEEIASIRGRESEEAAKLLGAEYHPPIANDLEIIYALPLLRKLAATVRKVKPQIILTHAPADYMEDHMATSRLAVTAAFAHCIPNFQSDPPLPGYNGDVAVYHAVPHGLQDGFRNRVSPHAFVNTASVHETKTHALAAHASQKDWLDQTQGMGSYISAMDDMSREVGTMSGKFKYAEGWTRHSHLGFSSEEFDPLADALGPNYITNTDSD